MQDRKKTTKKIIMTKAITYILIYLYTFIYGLFYGLLYGAEIHYQRKVLLRPKQTLLFEKLHNSYIPDTVCECGCVCGCVCV